MSKIRKHYCFPDTQTSLLTFALDLEYILFHLWALPMKLITLLLQLKKYSTIPRPHSIAYSVTPIHLGVTANLKCP